MGGFQYMEFIVPGLIMMSVIQNSYSNVVSFFSQKFQRSIEELLVSPVPNYVILTGFVVGGMARGLAVGAIVTTLSLFFVTFNCPSGYYSDRTPVYFSVFSGRIHQCGLCEQF